MPSYGGAHGPDGSKKSGDQGQGSRDSRGGQTGGSRGGGGFGGARGTASQQQDRRNLDNARRAGNAAPGVGANANRGTLAQQQDRINMNRALARSNTAPGVGNYSDAMDDYNNVGQGFFDDPLGAIGRFFGSGFGVGEIDPSTQAPKSFVGRPTASWGIDPIGAALGVGGSFFGPAGTLVSGLYNRGKTLAGVQGPMIAFDGNQPVGGAFSGFSNPFGGGQSSGGGSVQTASGVGGFGGQAAGGGTGNGNYGGYSPFRTGHTTGNPNVRKPLGSTLQPQTAQQQPNLYAKPWPGQPQSYSPFGNGSWAGWG
jgi:hypothetical protein